MGSYFWRLPAAAVFAFLVGLLAVPPATEAATFTVNSTADPGTGTCDVIECTLREAITQANSTTLGTDTIAFAIPGPGPHSIQPSSPLPAITAGLTIDGYTQAGSSVNTAPFSAGTNAVLMVELDGSIAGAGADGLRFDGAPIGSGPSIIRGLVINRFSGNGIRIAGGGGPLLGMTVEGNFVGTNVSGTADLGNGGAGVTAELSLHTIGNTISGSTTPAARNIISGNGGPGIAVTDSGTPVIRNNLIGTGANGTVALGNSGDGITVAPGLTAVSRDGVIAHNGDAGIGGPAAGTGGSADLRTTSIHSNAGPGLNITGPNPPALSSASSSGGNTTVQGTYSGLPDTLYRLEFYANAACDPSGSGEGETFIGSADITTDGSGNASFNETFPVTTDAGASVTATGNSSTESTSNFSECRTVPGAANDDDADGVRDDAEANCDGDATNPNIRPERIDGDFAGVSDDGDAAIDEALPAGATNFDCDGDGYKGSTEDHVYSYLPGPPTNGDQKTCQEYDTTFPNSGSHIRPSKRWPSDLATGAFSGNKINVQDLSTFTNPIRYLNKDVGTFPGDVRFDLVPGAAVGTDINVTDLAALTTSTSGSPAMLNGVRAFNGPVCPTPP